MMIIIIIIIFIYIVSILKPITPIIHGMDNLNSSKFIPLNITSNDEFSIMATKVNESSLIFKNELKKLENISKARTQFFSNAAHEFRTPLFLLKGYAETLIDGGINDPKINKTYIQKILQKSMELENIFKQLSDISKIESNEIIIKKEPILLNDILIWIKENFEDLAKQKQIILSIPDTKKILIEGDYNYLKICFSNLIQNSINYSNSGTISIIVKNVIDKINIQIIDNGIGIEKKYHSRIFERFFRIEDSRSKDFGGSGLGLSIVKHILKAHGAKITLSSNLGEGSIFSFNLKKLTKS